jgi:antiphage defense system Thoeris ThsB-like protein
MFRRKNANTKVENVESTYGVELNARGDAKLGNLLRKRGFDSQSQLIRAARGQLTEPARVRKLFLSFHYEDRGQVNGFRLMAHNPNLPFDFSDVSIRAAINSEEAGYLKRTISEKINRCSVVVCLIGNGTAWREWVEWELETALRLGKGVCGVRLKGSRGQSPGLLRQVGAPVAGWDQGEIVAAIECAAARRS